MLDPKHLVICLAALVQFRIQSDSTYCVTMLSAMRIVVSMSSGSWVRLDLYRVSSTENEIVVDARIVGHELSFVGHLWEIHN